MFVLWLVSIAEAAPPDHIVRLWQIGAGSGEQVERMAVSESGDVLVGRTRGDLGAWMLDIDGWTMHPMLTGDCEVTGVAPIDLEGGTVEIWMSCGDGSVRGQSWDGEGLSDVVDEDGAPLVFEGIADALSGIFYDPLSQLLYAVYAPADTTQAAVHVIDPFAGTWDTATGLTYPITLPHIGFNEAVIVDGTLIVSHGGGDMSSLLLGSSGAVAIPDVFTGAFACEDLTPRPTGGGVYCVASAESGGFGSAAEYTLATNQFYALQLGDLLNPQAICANPDLSDGWLAVTGDQVTVWEMNDDGGIPDVANPYFQNAPDAGNPIQDMVTDDGYLYGGGIAGNLHIVTARPWVYPEQITVEPSDVANGATVAVSFQVNDDSDWVLRLGGDRYGESGIILKSGKVDADTTETVEIEVDDRFAEGDNQLYVIATNDDDLDGHGRATLNVDNPPDPPNLSDANLQFADGALVLTFDGISDEDLAHYEVYVSTTPFDNADFVTGGPPYDGETGLKTPIIVDSDPGLRVTHRIAPLTNGVTYYIGLHALDEGGKEGPMSKVIKGMPMETFTAAQLAGDPGGSPCSTGPSGAVSWLGLLGVTALVARRRAAAAAALLVVGLGVSGNAQAQDDDPWWRQDTTKAKANFEIRYGVIGLKDPEINKVYTRSSNLLQMEMGPQIFRVAEVDFSFGFLQELSHTIASDGTPSGDRTMLTWWPLAVDVTARAHILDEQPVVPFVRYGWDYVIWSEKEDNASGGKNVLNGGKFGTHAALGANFLLDLVSPGRASLLEAQTGINDSWLTVEWRRQTVDARSAPWSGRSKKFLDFSGDAVLIGLKLDW